MTISVRHLKSHSGETVTVRGWLSNKQRGDKSGVLQIRDGSDIVQCVISRADVSEEAWEDVKRVTQESTVRVTGIARVDERAPGGVEIQATDFAVRSLTEDYPITNKEHDIGFLMEHRHLWLRSNRQRAALTVRSEICQAIRDFFYEREHVLIDSPILTPISYEGTSTLFETEYFGDKAYLSQSGQLYLEPACAAFGKVYCMGPTFRAEESKARSHLMECWMVEPEVAFLDFEGCVRLAEELIIYLAGRVLERAAEPLKVLERDTSNIEKVTGTFPRITYKQAIEILRQQGKDIAYGDAFGDDDETVLANQYDQPVFVTHFPVGMKAFYMQPDPDDPEVALAMGLLAPEGYGEIIGGSQRIHDHDLLLERLQQHNLPIEPFQWYLDVRKYGSFPHSGFGMGIERFVAWICGMGHPREATPYPRMLHQMYP